MAKQTAKWELCRTWSWPWAEWRTRVEKWGRVTVTRSVDSHDRRVIVAAEWFDERTLTSSYDVATVDNVRKAQALGLAMVRQLRDDAICARGGA